MLKKICRTCKQEKLEEAFYKNRMICKACVKEYSKANKEYFKEYNKKYSKKYREANKERCKERLKEYRKANVAAELARSSNRRALKAKATPTWLTDDHKKEIINYFLLAEELAWLSEEPFHVDHIVPLKGKIVCGLHVPWNLQLLPASMNLNKYNSFT